MKNLGFSKTFLVKGNVSRTFDLAKKYVSGMRFKIVNDLKPKQLVLVRGSALGLLVSKRVEDLRTTLTISFSQKGENVTVSCNYDILGYGGIFNTSGKSDLEDEVERLRRFLESAL